MKAGAYIVNMETNPLKNMPSGCYSWGTLVMFRSTDSFLLMYVENNRYMKVWITNQWGTNEVLAWRAL